MARWTFCFTLFALLPTPRIISFTAHGAKLVPYSHGMLASRVSRNYGACILFVIYSGFWRHDSL